MKNLTPQAEPVGWATFVALAIAAALSYGANITSELGELLVFAGPMVLAALWARFKVYAPDTMAQIEADTRRGAYDEGFTDAKRAVTSKLNGNGGR